MQYQNPCQNPLLSPQVHTSCQFLPSHCTGQWLEQNQSHSPSLLTTHTLTPSLPPNNTYSLSLPPPSQQHILTLPPSSLLPPNNTHSHSPSLHNDTLTHSLSHPPHQLVFESLFGNHTTPKLRSLALQFVHHICRRYTCQLIEDDCSLGC